VGKWKEKIKQRQKQEEERAVHKFLPDQSPSKVTEKDNLHVEVKENLNIDEEVQENVEVKEKGKVEVQDNLIEDLNVESNVIVNGDNKEQEIEKGKEEVAVTEHINFTLTHRTHQATFEDQYKRKTFAIERELLKRFNNHMRRFPKGEQTRVINELLRQYVRWLDSQTKKRK
jgi:hypothetical protein